VNGGIGLTRVPESELVLLLKWLHRGELRLPYQRSHALESGLPYLSEHGDAIFGLDATALRAVLTAVLAERRAKK
jgi:hypothetical protein